MGVETHNNRYFYDTDTVNFVEMLGGYIDGNFFVPIRFGVKVSQTGRNSLYIVVSENKIEKSRVIKPRSQKESAPNGSRLPIVSISKVLENVNSKDILRYVPDGFLSGERLKAKYEAIAETIKYTNDKNDKKYREYIKKGDMKSAQRMVKAAAKVGENGYSADVLVGVKDDGSAVLYDIINISDKKTAENPTVLGNDNSRAVLDVSADNDSTTLTPESQEKTQNSRKTGRSATYHAYEIMDLFGIKQNAENRNTVSDTITQPVDAMRYGGEYMDDKIIRDYARTTAEYLRGIKIRKKCSLSSSFVL